MAEYTEYHPLKFWLDPASIAEIVAHIQTYLVNNPINSTTEIETIIHDYLIAHPELIGGVDSVNGQTGEVVLTADNISGGENVTIKDVLDSLQDQIDDIVASIPSDYQQLIDDVSDLKSAIDSIIDYSYSEVLNPNNQYNLIKCIGFEWITQNGTIELTLDDDLMTITGASTANVNFLLEIDEQDFPAGTYYIIPPVGMRGNNVYGINFCGADKVNMISTAYINSQTFGTITLSSDLSNVKYIKVLLGSPNYEFNISGYFWMTSRTTPSSQLTQEGYQPKYIESNQTIKSNWAGKAVVSFGDSQTEQNKWQPLIVNKLGIKSLVKGFSGYPITVVDPNNQGFSLASDYILNQLETYLSSVDFDTILIMGGSNDWVYDGERHPDLYNVLIGENTDTSIRTFKGALKKIVKTIITNHPTKQVILMSPIGGQTREAGTNLQEPMTNANGYTLGTFADAVREIAEYIGIPFIDVHSCGITCFNSATYLVDGLHLNTTTGPQLVANKVISGLINNQNWI